MTETVITEAKFQPTALYGHDERIPVREIVGKMVYALKGYSVSTARPVQVEVLQRKVPTFQSAGSAEVREVKTGAVFTVPDTWLFDKRPKQVRVEDEYGIVTVWR